MAVHQFDIQFEQDETIIVIGNEDEAGNCTHYYWVLKNLCSALGLGYWRDVAESFDSNAKTVVDIDIHTDEKVLQEQVLAVDTYSLVMYLAKLEDAVADGFIEWLITEAMPFLCRIICTERLCGSEFVLSDEQRRRAAFALSDEQKRSRTARNRRKKQKRRDKRKIRKLAELSEQNDATDTNETVKERITTNV